VLTTQLARVDARGAVSALTPPFAASEFSDPVPSTDAQIPAWDAAYDGTLAWSSGNCIYVDRRPNGVPVASGSCPQVLARPGADFAPNVRGGTASMTVACLVAARTACEGAITATAVRGRRRLTLARGSFRAGRFRIARVRAPLTAAGRAFFATARGRRAFEDRATGEILGVVTLRTRDGTRTRTTSAGMTIQDGENFDSG
jgi:hypothetical protein